MLMFATIFFYRLFYDNKYFISISDYVEKYKLMQVVIYRLNKLVMNMYSNLNELNKYYNYNNIPNINT